MSDLVEFLRAQNEATRRAVTDGDLYEQPDWPAWVLAQCDAVDAIIGALAASDDGTASPMELILGDDVLELLAVPYADHPEYREEWRP